MTYVIAPPCIGSKDQSCTEVCPVDCIHPTQFEPGFAEAEQLYIDPRECIDCSACVAACPVQACFADHDLPSDWDSYRQVNRDYYRKRRSGMD